MADKEFNIRIGTEGDTSGAEKVEDALDKAGDAAQQAANPMAMTEAQLGKKRTDDLAKSLDGVSGKAKQAEGRAEDLGGALEDVAEEAEQAGGELQDLAQVDTSGLDIGSKPAESVEQLRKEHEKLNDTLDEQRRKSQQGGGSGSSGAGDRVENDVRQIKQIQFALAAQEAAGHLRDAAGAAREFAQTTEGFDPELARKIEGIADGMDHVASATQGAAAGFVAGGPLGAIIGGAAAGGFSLLGTEVGKLVSSLENLAESRAISDSMYQRIDRVRRALYVKEAADSWRELKTEIKAAADEFESAAQIAEAKRGSDLFAATKDLEVARATGGDVAAAQKKVQDISAANAEAAIVARIEAAIQKLEDLQILDIGAKQNLQNAKDQGAPAETVAQLRNEAEAYAQALRDAKLDLETTKELGNIERGNITTTQNANEQINAGQQQRQAVDSLGNFAKELEKVPDLAPLAQQINAALSDKALSANELKNITTELNRYQGLIQSLGGTVATALKQQGDRLKDAENAIKTLIRQHGGPNN